ncbi:MAG: hypothetical protein ACOYMT_02585 [Chthoniobacterales bacterium]
MLVEHTGISKHRLGTTVAVSLWVLGAIALIEVILAAVALAPRLLNAARPLGTAPTAVTTSADAVGAANMPPPASEISAPAGKALQSSPVKEILTGTEKATDRSFHSLSTDRSVAAGAALGIVSVRLEGGEEGSRKLVITIKAGGRERIDNEQIKMQVYFYDEENGEISPSKAQVISNWMSPPVDWTEPELVEVRYIPESPDPSVKFSGYVVEVYYNGDLQDYRAEPSRLTKLFPLKYFIGLE